jgi:hypothetical protein
MTVTEALVLDLVEWVSKAPRSDGDVMEAWRTSCPRLTVWEEAAERGLIERCAVAGRTGFEMRVTSAGRRALEAAGRLREGVTVAPRVAIAGHPGADVAG